MNSNLVSKASCAINAPVSRVWAVLTTPELTKQFLFGAQAFSDWKVGSPIIFKGKWGGKQYENTGIVLTSKENELLRYSMPSIKDTPDEDIKITYELKGESNSTRLTITQENMSDGNMKKNLKYNWTIALNYLKTLVEEDKPRAHENAVFGKRSGSGK